jgi:hypothetical protein
MPKGCEEPKDRKRRLLKIDVDEISVVDAGANKREYLVVKNSEGGNEQMSDEEIKKDQTEDTSPPKAENGNNPGEQTEVKKGETPPESTKDENTSQSDQTDDATSAASDSSTKDVEVEKQDAALHKMMGDTVKTMNRLVTEITKALDKAYGKPKKEDVKKGASDEEVDPLVSLTTTVEELKKRFDEQFPPKAEEKEGDDSVEQAIEKAIKPFQDRVKELEESVGISKGEESDQTDAPVQKDEDGAGWGGVL